MKCTRCSKRALLETLSSFESATAFSPHTQFEENVAKRGAFYWVMNSVMQSSVEGLMSTSTATTTGLRSGAIVLLIVMLVCAGVVAAVWAKLPRIVIPKEGDVLHAFGGPVEAEGRMRDGLLKMLVWNVEKGKEETFGNWMLQLQEHCDLVLLQEFVNDTRVLDALLAKKDMHYNDATSFVYEKTKLRTGTATGCRAKAVSVVAQVTPDLEPIVQTPKTTLFTSYALPNGTTLLAVNIHGRNRGGLTPFQAQLANIGQVIASHTGPVICAGDWNTNSKEKRAYLEDWAHELSLEAVVFNPDGRTLSKLSRQPLDHVFVRGVVVEDAAALLHVDGSDHQPMLVSMRINV